MNSVCANCQNKGTFIHECSIQYCSIIYPTGLRDERKPLCAKGCHVPLTAFYRPVKVLVVVFVVIVVVFCKFHRLLMGFFLVEHQTCHKSTFGYFFTSLSPSRAIFEQRSNKCKTLKFQKTILSNSKPNRQEMYYWKGLLKVQQHICRGFIKGQAPGKLTGCDRDLVINLPGCFHLLFLLTFTRKTKNAQLKNPTDLQHKN